jgi:hypothetical protein
VSVLVETDDKLRLNKKPFRNSSEVLGLCAGKKSGHSLMS